MADEEQLVDWAKEVVPDGDRLFVRVHEAWRKNSDIKPGAFRNHGMGMSTDWEKYSTAHQTRRRARAPEKNAVVLMLVGSVRQVPGQRVEHTPDIERRNRAHTDVFGEKDEEARVRLRRIAEIVIPFGIPPQQP